MAANQAPRPQRHQNECPLGQAPRTSWFWRGLLLLRHASPPIAKDRASAKTCAPAAIKSRSSVRRTPSAAPAIGISASNGMQMREKPRGHRPGPLTAIRSVHEIGRVRPQDEACVCVKNGCKNGFSNTYILSLMKSMPFCRTSAGLSVKRYI